MKILSQKLRGISAGTDWGPLSLCTLWTNPDTLDSQRVYANCVGCVGSCVRCVGRKIKSAQHLNKYCCSTQALTSKFVAIDKCTNKMKYLRLYEENSTFNKALNKKVVIIIYRLLTFILFLGVNCIILIC